MTKLRCALQAPPASSLRASGFPEASVRIRLASRSSDDMSALTVSPRRAEVGGVDARAVRGEQLAEPPLHGVVGRRIVQPARDPRLVADRDDEEAGGVEPPDRLARAGEQAGAAGLVQESGVLENRGVPVEEDEIGRAS